MNGPLPFICLYLIPIIISVTFAQDTLKGRTVSEFGEPLSGCNVNLTDGRGGITNESGYFELIGNVVQNAQANIVETKISIKNDQVRIVNNKPVNVEIIIYTLKGEKIYTKSHSPPYSGEHNIDLKTLEKNAIYFLKVIIGSSAHHFKIIRLGVDYVLQANNFAFTHNIPLYKTGAEIIDTLHIDCPDIHVKKIYIYSYNTDLGEVTINGAGFKEEIIAKLSGKMEIEENITINNRHDNSSRAITRTYLKKKLEEFGIEPQVQSLMRDSNLLVANVYGIIPATANSKKYILFGAHFDTQGGPGANDNASGVALVMETAREMALLETRGINFIVAFFDKEEYRRFGSKAMAQFFVGNGYDISSVHTIDQVAWDNDGDLAFELELPTDQIFDFYNFVAAKNNFTTPIHRTMVGTTDHSSFREVGYDAVGITEEYATGDTSPHIHTPSDTYETVNFEYLDYVTSFFILVMKEYASLAPL